MQPQDENGFRITHDDTIETVVAYYREQIAASQEILRTVDLDAPCAWREMAGNLRWVAVHMIEETAGTLVTLTSSARPSTAAARNNVSRRGLPSYVRHSPESFHKRVLPKCRLRRMQLRQARMANWLILFEGAAFRIRTLPAFGRPIAPVQEVGSASRVLLCLALRHVTTPRAVEAMIFSPSSLR